MKSDPKIIVVSAHPDLKAELTPFGAGLFQLYFKGRQMLVTGLKNEYFQPNPAYFGQTVAPFAGRVLEGAIGPFHFPCNEGPNCLHSGPFTTAFKDFDDEIVEKEKGTEVVFTLSQVVEGVHLLTKTTYTFYKDAPRFSIQIDVTSSSPFPHNQTNHAYWNLGAETLDEIDLRFHAIDRVDYGPHKHPLGYVDCKEEFAGDRLLIDETLDYAYRLGKPTVTARVGDVLLKARSNGKAVLVFTGLSGLKPCFTLEFVHAPLNDDAMLQQGTSSLSAEYELEEL